MKKISRIFILFLLIFAFSFSPLTANAESKDIYIIGGFPIGIQIETRGACIVSLNEIITEEGVFSPGNDADLIVGDIILSIDGKETNTNGDIIAVLSNYQSGELLLEVDRKGEKMLKNITPCKDLEGNYRLGLSVRDNLTGIGTVTYVDKNGNFVALGHPVIDCGGCKVKIVDSKVFNCSIYGIVKGRRGKAGELKGIIMEDEVIGKLNDNKDTGIYGKLDKSVIGKKFEFGSGKIGKASIYTCIDGMTVKEYSISIVKAEKNSDNKDYVIKITDKALLKATGGIVQGMSGSPIVQSGKIVGAITHVFINDPTRGFGISINKIAS